MAFIDFADAAHTVLPAASSSMVSGTLADMADVLSALEHRIVTLARGDKLESLRPHRRRGWFARLLLGPTPPSAMLANEQLEALRRLAVHAWHDGYTLPASALKSARDAGHSEAKIGAVIDFIGRARTPFRRLPA